MSRKIRPLSVKKTTVMAFEGHGQKSFFVELAETQLSSFDRFFVTVKPRALDAGNRFGLAQKLGIEGLDPKFLRWPKLDFFLSSARGFRATKNISKDESCVSASTTKKLF